MTYFFIDDIINWRSKIPHNKHCIDPIFSNLLTFKGICSLLGCFIPGYSYFIIVQLYLESLFEKKTVLKLKKVPAFSSVLSWIKFSSSKETWCNFVTSLFNERHVFLIKLFCGENKTILLFIWVTSFCRILFKSYEFQMVSAYILLWTTKSCFRYNILTINKVIFCCSISL